MARISLTFPDRLDEEAVHDALRTKLGRTGGMLARFPSAFEFKLMNHGMNIILKGRILEFEMLDNALDTMLPAVEAFSSALRGIGRPECGIAVPEEKSAKVSKRMEMILG